jgi:hypothetical protein
MKVVFYARSWSVELFLAVEERWRAAGHDLSAIYIADHLQAAKVARDHGREATFLPGAIRDLHVSDPIEALSRLEARYDERFLPFMRYLMAERFFVARNPHWQIDQLARYSVFFDRLYRDERPDAIIGGATDTMASWLAYDIARQHGCQPVGLMPSGIPADRVVMCQAFNDIAGARESFERLRVSGLDHHQLARAQALQDIVLGTGTKLSYLPPRTTPQLLARRVLLGGGLRRQAAFALEQARERLAGNWYIEPNPVVKWMAELGPQVRSRVADRRYLHAAPSGRPFVFFPLHLEPEAVLLIQSSYFANQLDVVRNLARSLPIGWELVVKEHFGMRGRRKLSVYRDLARIPNVRLAAFTHDTNRLIRDAAVVAVIAGTAGLEAGLIGQPVVMFGDTVWDFAPTIHKVKALTGLPTLIRSAAEAPLGPRHPDVLAFAAAWDSVLPPGRYFNNRAYNWLTEDNLERLSAAIWNRACGAHRSISMSHADAPDRRLIRSVRDDVQTG